MVKKTDNMVLLKILFPELKPYISRSQSEKNCHTKVYKTISFSILNSTSCSFEQADKVKNHKNKIHNSLLL